MNPFRKLFALKDNSKIIYLSQRVVLAAVIFVGSLLLAKTQGPVIYGYIAFSIFLIKGIGSFSLGLPQGIIYLVFSGRKNDYLLNYVISYFVVCLIVIAVYFYKYDIWITILALIISQLLIIEPFLKTKRYFMLVLFPEVILVSSFLIDAFIKYKFNLVSEMYFVAIICCLIFTGLALFYYFPPFLKDFKESKNLSKFEFKKVLDLLKRGGAAYMFNLMFFLFLFVDRTMALKTYGDIDLGILMLAYQLALISGFIVSAFNFTAIVDIGEMKRMDPQALYKYLKIRFFSMAVMGSIVLVAILLFVYFTGDRFFSNYPDIFLFTLIIGLGLFFYNCYCSVSAILFFYKKQFIPNSLMFIATALVLVNHLKGSNQGLALLNVELVNYLSLSAVMIMCSCYAFYCVKSKISK